MKRSSGTAAAFLLTIGAGGMLLSGGAEPTEEQAIALIKAAVEACERYYQAFQFVVWAGKTAKEGMEGAILETVGEA